MSGHKYYISTAESGGEPSGTIIEFDRMFNFSHNQSSNDSIRTRPDGVTRKIKRGLRSTHSKVSFECDEDTVCDVMKFLQTNSTRTAVAIYFWVKLNNGNWYDAWLKPNGEYSDYFFAWIRNPQNNLNVGKWFKISFDLITAWSTK
jgi:hypothetical protein